uniref:MIT domain-containing protein n=1 Tax=Heterorhabditis bacteriophora TaxID=37862 RepID=A0A1I7W8J6_HETBA
MDYDAFDEIICRARTSTEDGDYHSAIVYYKEVIKEMESLSVTLSPPEKKKLLHFEIVSIFSRELKTEIADVDYFLHVNSCSSRFCTFFLRCKVLNKYT